MTALAEAMIGEAGCEPQIAALCVTERVVSLCAAIVYDRDVEGEDARATACHDALFARFQEQGFPPF